MTCVLIEACIGLRTVARLPALHYPLPLRSQQTKSLCAVLKRKERSLLRLWVLSSFVWGSYSLNVGSPLSTHTFVDLCVKWLEPCTPCQDSGSQASGMDPSLKVQVTVDSPG